jgi:hypothetical protein
MDSDLVLSHLVLHLYCCKKARRAAHRTVANILPSAATLGLVDQLEIPAMDETAVCTQHMPVK